MNLRSLQFSLVLLSAALAAGVAHAQQVDLQLAAGQLLDQPGTALADNSLVLLVVDTGSSSGSPDLSFSSSLNVGSSLTAGSFLNNSYEIIGTSVTETDGGTMGTVSLDTGAITLNSGPYASVSAGQSVAVIWFSDLNGSSTTLTAGAHYGVYTTGSPADGSDSWTVLLPTQQNGNGLLFLTTSYAGGSNDPSLAVASDMSAVPEPSTWALLAGVAALGFAVIQRRRVGAA
jgi:hypothetical protein